MATSRLLFSTWNSLLCPCLDSTWNTSTRLRRLRVPKQPRRFNSTTTSTHAPEPSTWLDTDEAQYLDQVSADYSYAPFIDACTLTVAAGPGGHGCISFLREKYIANGPPNGGDGGTGGSVYIQAVQGNTSLDKIARIGTLRAGQGRNGKGSLQGGARGADKLLTVPVGTVVREISRVDPLEAEEAQYRGYGADVDYTTEQDTALERPPELRRDKWLLYPGELPKGFTSADLPPVPRPRKNPLAASQPLSPIRLDLDKPMDTPILLAAGAMGGLGNPHFVSQTVHKPKYATKGEAGMRIKLQLELKLLADVGLVGLPNAGKSTFLRALTASRTRVGNWAFTTLSPTIGTLVLDNYTGRPRIDTKGTRHESRTRLTIADIPGLIEDAHLDRGLGLGFLRHIERAAVLAFVIDLNAGDPVAALKALWREVGEYEDLRHREMNADSSSEHGLTSFKPFETSDAAGTIVLDGTTDMQLPPLFLPPISTKPWLVVATKADLPGTQERYQALQEYLRQVQAGEEEHPSGKPKAWRSHLYSLPISAIKKAGVSSFPEIILRLLDS